MKAILKPAANLLSKTATLKNNNPVMTKGGVATMGFGVAFWVAYYIYSTASKKQ